ncbi:hypothetical protein [Streptomyces chrestomyceticus]|uniref:hypothetical protein n=1 Tax=Streptomyces chrestomyceticus TaxID=68185 RepID=UPI0037B31093
MDAEAARHVDVTLRRLGIRGVVAPEEPGRTAGGWRVYDSPDHGTRKDITPDVLAAVVARFGPPGAGGGPARGFVVPPGGN